MDFVLSQELHGGEDSVRCICSVGDVIAVGGQDRMVRLYLNGEIALMCIEAHNWVTCCIGRSDGYLITGSRDKNIYVYKDGVFLYSLSGHENGLTSLCFSESNSDHFISGSWDGTARLWSLSGKECLGILAGHENGVCVLSLANGDVVTGSTGVQTKDDTIEGFQIRIWREGKVFKVLRHHQGGVRALTLVSGFGFCSVGNDGMIFVYSNEGDELFSLGAARDDGHPDFILCVCALPTGEIVSGGEDRVLKIWKDGNLKQTILFPNTIWDVKVHSNGDLLVACADKVGRVLTRDLSRVASEEMLKAFSEAATNKSNKSEIKVNELRDYADRGIAAKDGFIECFRKDGKAYAYRFDKALGDWINIGEVVENPNDNSSKHFINGVEVDHVVDVEVETSMGLQTLKLGYKTLESPYDSAQRFINDNKLEQHYLQQIAEYVSKQKSSRGPTLGDKSSSSSAPSFNFFPIKSPVRFDALVNLDGLVKKLNELLPLEDSEKAILASLTATLSQTSTYHVANLPTTHFQLLYKCMSILPPHSTFPILDLLRMIVILPNGLDYYKGEQGDNLIKLLLNKASEAKDKNAIILLTFRLLTNICRSSPLSGSFTYSNINQILSFIVSLQGYSYPANVHQAIFSFLNNLTYSITKGDIVCEKKDISNLFSIACKGLSSQSDSVVLSFIGLVVGTLLLKGDKSLGLKEIAKSLSLLTTVLSLSSIDKGIQNELISILSM